MSIIKAVVLLVVGYLIGYKLYYTNLEHITINAGSFVYCSNPIYVEDRKAVVNCFVPADTYSARKELQL